MNYAPNNPNNCSYQHQTSNNNLEKKPHVVFVNGTVLVFDQGDNHTNSVTQWNTFHGYEESKT